MVRGTHDTDDDDEEEGTESMTCSDVISAASLKSLTPAEVRKPLTAEPGVVSHQDESFAMRAKVVPRSNVEVLLHWCAGCLECGRNSSKS